MMNQPPAMHVTPEDLLLQIGVLTVEKTILTQQVVALQQRVQQLEQRVPVDDTEAEPPVAGV